MAGAAQRTPPRMSVELFRQFVEDRPDEEHWELIDGVAMMMAPPTKRHQRIASNLESLLLDALAQHAPTLTAYQASGVNLAPAVEDYDPEPDVVVVDAGDDSGRYSSRFYLAAEIVSADERVPVQRKREVYKLHAPCKYILTIQQDRIEVQLDLRTDDGWQEITLKNPEDMLVLADFGLRREIAELYRRTELEPQDRRS